MLISDYHRSPGVESLRRAFYSSICTLSTDTERTDHFFWPILVKGEIHLAWLIITKERFLLCHPHRFLTGPPDDSGMAAKWLLRTISWVIYMNASSHQFIGWALTPVLVHPHLENTHSLVFAPCARFICRAFIDRECGKETFLSFKNRGSILAL